jgi:1-aminocyclopropane-1-carboxylate deaminase/D-cysteine desulfhydrase-like pyridoxal-dependent ACC family enzyme
MAPRLLGLAQGTADLLHLGVKIGAADVHIEDAYMGGGYGIPTAECDAAIRLALETEGLVLDPVYTGKAMAGLAGLVRRGAIARDATVVFVHTGGEPGLYARHADYAEAARPA